MLCVSRRPSGRLEVVQLLRVMDDMLLKAGVDEQSGELTELSQVKQTDRLFCASLGQTLQRCSATKCLTDGESPGVGADGATHLQRCFP